MISWQFRRFALESINLRKQIINSLMMDCQKKSYHLLQPIIIAVVVIFWLEEFNNHNYNDKISGDQDGFFRLVD